MAIDVRYVCDDGECVWLEGKKYRCLKNAKDMLHSCTTNAKEYVERMEYLAIQVFVLCTIENDRFFEEYNIGNKERRI
ncbi:MAG: hypothetical protein IKK33_07840 [Lachnospiraceae bacterium]|nr:hypothetical protein [Lachnospiraceae bacterium]